VLSQLAAEARQQVDHQSSGWNIGRWAIKKTYAENIDKENGKMAQRRQYSREGIKK
jgi:hypothetical protein